MLKGNSANTGTGTYSAISVTDPTDPLYGHSLTLTFQTNAGTGRMQYSIMDTTTGTAVGTRRTTRKAWPSMWHGVSFSVKGAPADGDTMTAKPAQRGRRGRIREPEGRDRRAEGPDHSTGMNQEAANANLQNVIATGIRQFSNSLDINVLTGALVGGLRLNEIDALDTIGENRALSNAQTLSGLQDLDYAAAISEFYPTPDRAARRAAVVSCRSRG